MDNPTDSKESNAAESELKVPAIEARLKRAELETVFEQGSKP